MTTSNDTPLWFRQKTATTTGYAVLGAVALMSLCLSVGQGRASKFFLYSLASASCVGAKVLKKASDEAGYILEDTYTTTSLNRQRNLLSPAPKPLKEPTPKFSPTLFNWQDLKNTDTYPVVIISGKQGSGKTTAGEYLGCLVGTGKRYAVSPHLKPSDFMNFDGKFGGGANYFREDDYIPSWSQVEANPNSGWTIHQTLTAIENLITSRLKAYALGTTEFQQLDIYLDETVAIQRYFRTKCPDKTLKKFLEGFLAMAFTEPRKVKVRFWILTQAETVEALGLTGMAGLKNDSLFIRLNHNAMRHAKLVAKQRYLSKDSLDWLLQQSKPVMVDESIAQLPTIWEMRSLIEDVATRGEAEDTAQPSAISGTGEAQPSASETDTEKGLQADTLQVTAQSAQPGTTPAKSTTHTEKGMPTMPSTTPETNTPKNTQLDPIPDDHASTDTYAAFLETLGTADSTRLSTVVNGRDLCQLKRDTLLVYASTRAEGKAWSKTSIIQEFWGLGTGGTANKFGRNLWKVLQIGALKE